MSTATSSTTQSSRPSSNDTLSVRLVTEGVAKDVRSHERARRRAKEREEHAQAKGRKEKAAVLRALGFKVSSSTSSGGHGGKPAAARKYSMEIWDGDQPDVSPWSKPSCVPLEPATVPLQSNVGPSTELTLADLISVPRPQKKGKSVKQQSWISRSFHLSVLSSPWTMTRMTRNLMNHGNISLVRASSPVNFRRRGGLMHKLPLLSNLRPHLQGQDNLN
ncbi:hypothetical protein M404DRAFT_424465 [Pisolithus tinctorius Marx 270]|uniref:Uncharacterized protein n=1 Tax=Pisolithus tinctorius Marx 270 TaxID=870435 RepID=A0A0C3P1S5_PISTI|nr:hypothetical protein M404DRAFT_424465 [Pisolithus tinctorius Marx 270]